MKQLCALLLGASLASLANAALLRSTRRSASISDDDVPKPGQELEWQDGAQGHGTVKRNYWDQTNTHWRGARGKRKMCAPDDPYVIYNFSMYIWNGNYHQIGVANQDCCKGIGTNGDGLDRSYASLYSHHSGWNSNRGAATPVGEPSKLTWWSGTWDSGERMVLVTVSCEKKTFTVGLEDGDVFLGEMSWPDSWKGVYAFASSHGQYMRVYAHWRGVQLPPPPDVFCPELQLGNRTNPWRCDDHAPDENCSKAYTTTRYGLYMRCGLLSNGLGEQRCGHAGPMCSTTTTTTTLHPFGFLTLQPGSQGYGQIYFGNRWKQGGSSWKGVRGERRMCFDGDRVTTYKFKVRIDGGSHHQIGVANEECCRSTSTNGNDPNANYAAMYSHHSGWNSQRGAATPVGSPSTSTWWSGTWDGGHKVMLVKVSCSKHTFTLGREGVDDFMGEMTFPRSWSGVYAFVGQQSSNMDASCFWDP